MHIRLISKCLNRPSKAKTIAEKANVQLTHSVQLSGKLLCLTSIWLSVWPKQLAIIHIFPLLIMHRSYIISHFGPHYNCHNALWSVQSRSKLLTMHQILFLWHCFIVPMIVPHSKPLMACFHPFIIYPNDFYHLFLVASKEIICKPPLSIILIFMIFLLPFIHMNHIYPRFITFSLVPFSLVLFPYFLILFL